ncbi:MAG: hypothetical protein VW930_07735 [Burkholderiaceae bacterium]
MTVLKPITLPGEALGWTSTVLEHLEEELQNSLKWLPMGDTSDEEIVRRVKEYNDCLDDDDNWMVELLKAMRDLDLALSKCPLPEIA